MQNFIIRYIFSDSWKRWKQELEFNMDLAMNGREEATKVKLFLYLIGSQGREIYDTMAFEVPASERTLTQVWAALYGHCNPRKNETVESFKFFSRTQDPGESQEKIIADFKLLATTCNLGDPKDSLLRDRIIWGIQDQQLFLE